MIRFRKVCDIEHRTQFQEHLNETYTYKFCEPFHEIKVKHLCAVYVDKNWCRAEIVDIAMEMQPMVYLLDYGRTVPVNRKELCILKFAHALIRPFAIKCQLSILNGVALEFCETKSLRTLTKFKRIAGESNAVCIYLNESISLKNVDCYTNVLVFTDFQIKANSKRAAYPVHEAYGVFCWPKVRFDDEICELWMNSIKSMENAVISNATKRVPVFLTHIESPIEFYVQCEPVKLFMSKIRRIIDGYAGAQLVNYDFNGVNWTIDDNCLVRVQNWNTKASLKLWYRGKIIAINKGTQRTYKVLLVDYGRRTEVSRLDLMTISPELAACSKAVQKCSLAISRRWIASGAQLFNEAIEQYRSFAISCVQKVKGKSTSNMYVDLWATNSSTPDVKELGIWVNIGYSIICTAIRKSLQPFILESQHRYNASKLKHMQDEGNSSRICLSSTDEDVNNNIPINVAAGNGNEDNNNNSNKNKDDESDIVYVVNSDLLEHEPIVKKWLKPVMFESDILTFRGMITHITDRGVIYVQEEANHELAQDVSATLSSHMMEIRNVRNQREWKSGDACFAEYEVNQYHRAVIKRIYREQGTCLVSRCGSQSLS